MPKDVFFNLPEEKRNSVINSAFAAFGKSDHKKTSTDDVALAARIS
jgi:hypothetical protein